AHVDRGVFGSHVANVLRRLRRIAAAYGTEPRFLLTSATIDNPVELAERLQSEGHPVIRRWRYVVLGAENEDEARDLAQAVQKEAPATASVRSAPVPFAHFDRAAGWRRY
ncbi:MAG: hypothetical protein LBV78_00240, partial [Kitasatospora sp.]|nr:hypothetical protein [Kitasatospora sp.]